MNNKSLLLIGLLSAFGSAGIAGAHGTEREFGTEINGGNRSLSQVVGVGSPAFTLVVIESNSRAMLRAVEDGQAVVVQRRASRLSGLMKQLRHCSAQFSASDHQRVTVAIAAIAESVDRVSDAATIADAPELKLEIGRLLGDVASYKRFLREKSRVDRDDALERQFD